MIHDEINVMVDIETLGTNVDSQVVSIGAVAFLNSGEVIGEFYEGIKPNYGENVQATLGTIRFWMTQPEDARDNLLEVISNGEREDKVMASLHKFISSKKNCCKKFNVWANGTKFDLGMLEFMFSKHGISVPWMHNRDRCMRTLRYITKEHYGVDVHKYLSPLENAHDALEDARYQAAFVVKALEVIKSGTNQ